MQTKKSDLSEDTKIRINLKDFDFEKGDFSKAIQTNTKLETLRRSKRIQKLQKHKAERLQDFSKNLNFFGENNETFSEATEGTTSPKEGSFNSDVKLKRDFSFGDITNDPFPGFNIEKQLKNMNKKHTEIPVKDKVNFLGNISSN